MIKPNDLPQIIQIVVDFKEIHQAFLEKLLEKALPKEEGK